MAGEPGLSELITTTLRLRSKKLKDAVSNNNAVFYQMDKVGSIEKVSGGRTIVEEVGYAQNSTFKRYEGGEQLNISSATTMTAFEYDWKQAAVAVTITGREQLQNSGPEGVIKLLASRVKIAEDTLLNYLNSDALSDGTADGGKQMGGLALGISQTPTVGVIGGIDRSTSAGAFARNYALNFTTAFGSEASAANIKQGYTRAKINITRQPDGPGLALAGNNHYEFIQQASQAIQRVTDPKMAELGFENIYFCGIPVVLGGGVSFGGQSLVPDGVSYMINPKYTKLVVHKDCDMDPLETRFSINQHVEVRLIAWMGNMVYSNPKLNAVLFN